MQRLKYNDVRKRARLRNSTGQYVLKSGKFPGTPPAGDKGKHRVFSFKQAFRFALATRLVMAGVPVRSVAEVLKYCDRRLAQFTGSPVKRKEARRFTPGEGWLGDERLKKVLPTDWTLEIVDDDLVRLCRPDMGHFWGDDEYYSIQEGRAVRGIDFPAPISRHEIDLSLLERELARDL